MPIPHLLNDLLRACGPSGYERAVAEPWRNAARGFADVYTDSMGNSFARVTGTSADAPSVAIFGHIDEIGLIVIHIDEHGFLRFNPSGAVDPQVLVGQRVTVDSGKRRVPGVVAAKPVDLEPDKAARPAAPENLHIDIGARTRSDARGLVHIGDVATIDAAPVILANNRVASKALDNRLGAYISLEAARMVAEAGGAAGDVIAVATVQEELGCRGAGPAAYSLNPTVAVVTDVTDATDAPGIDATRFGEHPLGSGPVIGRGPTLHPRLYDHLCATAHAEGIAFTVGASSAHTFSDGDATSTARNGIPTALVAFPLRYLHSPIELVQLDDVDNACRLIAAACLALPADFGGWR